MMQIEKIKIDVKKEPFIYDKIKIFLFALPDFESFVALKTNVLRFVFRHGRITFY